MRSVWRRLAARDGLFLAVSAAVFAGFEFLICAVVSSINIPALFTELSKSFPPALKGLIEQYIGGFGPADLLAFAWAHPIVLAVGAAVAIALAVQAVAGGVEDGTLELVLSQPISRGRYLAAHSLFSIAVLAAMSFAGAASMALGQGVYRLRAFPFGSIALMAASYFLLQAAWFSVTLLLSSFGRTAGRVSFAAFLLALLSYLAQVVGQLWPKAAFLVRYSLNGYHDPRAVLKTGGLPILSVAVLAGLAVVAIGLSFWRFERRDIP